MKKNPVAYLRETLRLKQAELALLLNTSGAFISQIETGAVVPSELTLSRLAEIFGIEPIDLKNSLEEFYRRRRKQIEKKLESGLDGRTQPKQRTLGGLGN